MGFCGFAEGAGVYDATPIENMFLMEYMPSAPDDFLKVYLYARMLALHPELGEDLADAARVLHMDEDAVYNAMSYWERQGLVQRMTDRPPTYALLPLRGGPSSCPMMDSDYYKYRDFNANLQSLFGPENMLHPKQYALANDWLNLLGFTQEAVLLMVEARVKKSRSRNPERIFTELNKKAVKWADRGIRTAEDVQRALEVDGRTEKTTEAVMKQLSMNRPATFDEMKLVGRWLNEWKYTHEQILEACAETTRSRSPSLAYLNTILENKRSSSPELFEGVKAVLAELGDRATPTPAQMEQYRRFLDMGFQPETIRFAAIQCARKRKRRFEEVEWMLSAWAEKKVFTLEIAEAYIHNMGLITAEVRKLLKRCGSDKSPQMSDVNYYENWQQTYPKALIEYAADCAVGMEMPMRYIDKLLSEWQKSGVTTVDEAKVQHTNRVRPAAATAAAANPALQYEQRSLTDSDFDDLLIRFDNPTGGLEMTRAEHIHALLEEYAQQRAANESALNARIDDACERDPEIARLRADSVSLALGTMRSILALPTQEARIEAANAMKQRGIANNAELRRRLRALGLPENHLEPSYRCPVCKDTGYVGDAPARFCECFETRLRTRRYEDGSMAGIDEQNFDRFDITRFPETDGQRAQMAAVRAMCEKFADSFPDTDYRTLLLMGAGGLGKTFLLNCIYARVADRGLSAVRITAFRMFEAMRHQHFGSDESGDAFSSLIDAPLLLIDDLGTEPMMRNITVEYLFTLLNERIANKRHTVIATNLTPAMINERYGERVSSRLLNKGICGAVILKGKDLRKL